MRWVATTVETRVGGLRVAEGPDGLAALDFADADGRLERLAAARFGAVELIEGPCADSVARLRAWLAGDLLAFDGAPLMLGGTDFQRRVWAELLRIPPGETRTYGDLAAALGLSAGAARAVGLANGANPISIAVPCHRVVGKDGALTGYAGGLERKRWLLRHEGGALDGDRVLTAGEARQTALFPP